MQPPLLNWSPLAVLAASTGLTVLVVALLTVAAAWLRPSYAGWRGWAAGHSLLVLGMLVGTLRTPQTALLSILLGNGLVMVGSGLFVQAFYRFAGARVDPRIRLTLRLAVPAILAALYVLSVIMDNLTARFFLVHAYLAVLALALVHLIMKQHQHELRSAYGLNLAVLGVVCALGLPRALSLSLHPEAAYALNGPNVLMFVSVLVLSVGGTFTFWLLHDDRRRAEMGRLQHELAGYAFTDPLTSALNRRGLWRAFDRWAGGGLLGATLVALDIDHFKLINDEQGHAVGDRHLVALSRLLHELAAEQDLVGRCGGDEFTVLLTGSPAQVKRQLQHLKERVHPVTGALGFGVSFGWTQVGPEDTLDAALNRADLAMYQQKLQRRLAGVNIAFVPPDRSSPGHPVRAPAARTRDRAGVQTEPQDWVELDEAERSWPPALLSQS
ncbi:GGDEF domain-containing protein [Deinococcus hohokamensis]|uniref:GGDEF domain-containing protein n=1 Tax=Deinococcus hohokamensis TaxID=309883 RepID=A0ABV9I868_9DEIO